MLLICTCCGVGCAHIGCEQSSTGQEYDEEFVDSGADWFCCEVSKSSRAGCCSEPLGALVLAPISNSAPAQRAPQNALRLMPPPC